MPENNFPASMFPGALSLRWLTACCYEIRLPGGKTIVTDPFLPAPDDPMVHWRRYSFGTTVQDLEGGDYAIISHPHGDHVGSLMELFDRFGCRVLCHDAYAMRLVTNFQIRQQMVFPFENNQHYEFQDFTLDTVVARHSFKKGPEFLVRKPEEAIDPGTPFETLNPYGGLFNTNFIITAKNNLKVAFCGGCFEDVERNRWRNAGINVLLRQCGTAIQQGDVESVAADMMAVGAELMLPLHHEKAYKNQEVLPFAEKVNQFLEEKGYPGRMFVPRQGQWYQLGVGIFQV